MAESRTSLAGVGVAMGLILGAGLGTTAAVLLDVPTPTVTGFSAGGGLVVGAGAGRLAEANLGRDHLGVRIIGGATVFGLVVGAGIGGLTAWTADASLLRGGAIGTLVGVVHGLLLGFVLVRTLDRRRDGDVGE